MEDAQAIFEEYAADPEVTRYLTWAPHRSVESVSAFLESQIERSRAGKWFSWLITQQPAGRPIGDVGGRIQGHAIQIGYVLAREYWNRGYMSEAISKVAEWALAQPEVFRIWAVCDTENIASARMLEKSGFEREGLLRRWVVLPNRSSEPRDCYVYGRVR